MDGVENLGQKLSAVGTAGVVGFGLAVKSASAFQTELSGIQAVTGATVGEMDSIRDAALRLGKDTTFSASEAAQAISELAKAGISTADILNGAADATVALAAAGGVSLPEAATIASNAMNQFALTAQELPAVADSIAGAANASAIDVTDFGTSLSQVGAVAHLAGLSFQDTAVAIAELGNAGIKGSDAGTSLKTFLTNLIPVTDAQGAEFRRLGLQTFNLENGLKTLTANGLKPLGNTQQSVTTQLKAFAAQQVGAKVGSEKADKAYLKLASTTGTLKNQFFDAQGNTKSLADIQDVLAKSTAGMSKEQKLASLQLLFGSDAIRAAAILAENGAQGFTDMATAMGKVSAADVARIRMDNLSGAMEQLKGTIETIQIVLGTALLPALQLLVLGVNKVLGVFLSLPNGVQQAIAIFFAVASALSLVVGGAILLIPALIGLLGHFLAFQLLSPITAALRAFIFTLATGGGPAAAFSAALAAATARINLLISRGGVAAKVLTFLGRALRFAFSGPGVFLIALAAAFYLAYKYVQPFHDAVDRLANVLKDKFGAAVQYAKDAFAIFLAGLRGADGSALNGFFGVVADGASKLRDAFDIARLAIKNFLTGFRIGPAVDAAGGTLSGFLKVGQSFALALQKVRYELDAFLIGFRIGPAVAEAGATLSGFLAIGQGARAIVDSLAQAFQAVLPALSAFASTVGGALLAGLQTIMAAVTGSLVPALVTLGQTVAATLVPSLVTFYQAAAPIAVALAKLAAVVGGVLLVVLGQVVSFVVGSLIPGFIQLAGPVIGAVVGAIAQVVAALIVAIAWFLNVVSVVVEFVAKIGSIQGVFIPLAAIIGTVLIPALVGLAVAAATTAVSVVTGFVSMAAAAAVSLASSALAFGAMVVGWVTSGAAAVAGAALSVASWVATQVASVVAVAIAVAGFVAMAAGWVASAVAATAGAIAIAAAWLIALGPIALVVAAVIAVAVLIAVYFDQIRNAISTAWNAVSSATSSAWNTVRSTVVGAASAIGSAVSGAMDTVRSTVSNAFSSAVSAVRGGVSDIMGILRGLPGQIAGALGNLGGLLVGAGRAIIQGLIDGIQGAIGRIKDILSSVTSLIPSWKGPYEKDKILLEANGEVIMQGLIRGIQNQLAPLRSTLGSITTGIPQMVAPPTAGYALRSQLEAMAGQAPQGAGVNVQVDVNAPQNMSPEQVGTMVARRVGYSLSSHTSSPLVAVGA